MPEPESRRKELLKYRVPLMLVVVLGFAPFYPQPHIVEKIRMLSAGRLSRPLDLFDLLWHGWPFLLLGHRLILDGRRWLRRREADERK